MSEDKGSTVQDVQAAWTQAIQDFNQIEDMEGLVAWAVKYVPDPALRKRAKRYAFFPGLGGNRFLLERRLLDPLFEAFRAPYDSHLEANLGIAIAPNSQAFSFTKIVDRLLEEDDDGDR